MGVGGGGSVGGDGGGCDDAAWVHCWKTIGWGSSWRKNGVSEREDYWGGGLHGERMVSEGECYVIVVTGSEEISDGNKTYQGGNINVMT